ncbi:TetR/AcrR family transcriptional regulator [Mycobacterium sp. 2YAF39]|uniref:TetR/AcrR family transcriptional regulator n=1 Tax=Mycobacterium sp. 2YAF39 TaxID=3233033 RepID=UPI003F9E1545
MTSVSQPRAARGRRTGRPSGDDRELAILETASRLLDERPLHEISVDDLAKGAGISRPTFYFYFPSKVAVVVTLIERVILEADSAVSGVTDQPIGDRLTFWRTGINIFCAGFGAHKGVSRAGYEARATIPAIAELWSRFMQKWIDNTAAIIEAERARGQAPVTLPAHDLATALNLMNERVMMAAFSEERPAVPEQHVLDTLAHIWITSIYGTAAN